MKKKIEENKIESKLSKLSEAKSSDSRTKSSSARQTIIPTPKAGIPRRNLLLIMALATVTVFFVIFAVFVGSSPKATVVSKPVVDPNAYKQTTLNLTTPQTASPEVYQSEIKISSKENQILAVGLRLTFDPKVLSVSDIQPGSFFTNPIVLFKKIDSANGLIDYDLVLMPNQAPAQGNGTVAIISFSPIVKGTATSINFLTSTKAMAKGYLKSALKTAGGVTFSIK